MIRLAKDIEIDKILTITQACALHMINQGIYQWNEHYPSRNAFCKDLNRKELYVLLKEGHIIGTIVASTLKDKEYESINWLTQDEVRPLYIHRLSIHPEHQGKGYAQKLMQFAENLASKNGHGSIRLDTFSQNKRNQLFYEQRGYKRLGDIYFPKQSLSPFYCYELVLNG